MNCFFDLDIHVCTYFAVMDVERIYIYVYSWSYMIYGRKCLGKDKRFLCLLLNKQLYSTYLSNYDFIYGERFFF